jgi:hypothetical protein
MSELQPRLVGLLFLTVASSVQADWWIAYSPVIVKHTGQSSYCCFPTKAACEAARAQKLQPADSIGCFGFDSPSAKQKQGGGQSKEAKEAQAKAAAQAKAQREAQLKLQEQKFREAMQGTLHEFKGLGDGGDTSGLSLKPVPPAGGQALGQLQGSAAWSDAATRAKTDEDARAKAELGAQGAGGLKLPDGAVRVPEPPAPTPVEVQQKFLSLLLERKQTNQQQSRQTEQQIRALEQKLQASEAGAARQESELAGLKLKETPAAGKAEDSEAQRQAREALERAKAEQQKLKQELERRRREREQLAQDEQRLQQLETQYQAEPQRAGELMGQLGR